MKQILLCISALLAVCLNLHAQSITIGVDVSHNDGYKTVSVSNELHTVQGANATYTISVAGLGNIEQVVSCQYTYNGTTENLGHNLNAGILTINPVSKTNLSATSTEPNKFSVSLVVKESGKAGNTDLSAVAQNVRVHAEPTCVLSKAPSRFIYQGSTPNPLEWELTAKGGGTWKYHWTSSAGHTGSDNSFTLPVINKSATVTVTAENMAPDNVTVWKSYSSTSWEIIIYEKANANVTTENQSSNPKLLFQNMSWGLSATPVGGYPDGWTYEWKDADSGEVLGRSQTFDFSNPQTDNIESRHITLTVINTATIGGTSEEWFRKTYNYYAKFYPLPIVEFANSYPADVINGDKTTMSATIKDRHGNAIDSDSQYSWTYKWNNGESSGKTYTYTASNQNNNDGISNTITLEVTGTLKGGDGQIYNAPPCQHVFVAWPTPSIEDLSESGVTKVECGGRTLELKVATTGGMKTGWTFKWSKDDEEISGATENIFKKTLERGSSEPMISESYSVRVINVCEGKKRADKTFSYPIQVYPEPWAPEDVDITDINRNESPTIGIREGNKVKLVCKICYGGYPNAWSYTWKNNNSIISNNSSTETTIDSYSSGDSQDNSRTVSLQCNVNNSYNGIPWKDQTYTKNLVIYKKPQTPKSIVKKGSGESGTVIATTNVTDADLVSHDYYLVFGYIDSNGIMHDESSLRQENPGAVRWSVQIPASIINNSSYTLYVYALWKYPNGEEITSGLRTVSDVNEDWDNSTYSGMTRSVISNYVTDLNDAQLKSSQSEIIETYSVIGVRTNKHHKGLNIVKMGDGSVKKIIVK